MLGRRGRFALGGAGIVQKGVFSADNENFICESQAGPSNH